MCCFTVDFLYSLVLLLLCNTKLCLVPLAPCVSGAGLDNFDLLIRYTSLYHVVLFEISVLLAAYTVDGWSQITFFVDSIK